MPYRHAYNDFRERPDVSAQFISLDGTPDFAALLPPFLNNISLAPFRRRAYAHAGVYQLSRHHFQASRMSGYRD